MEQVYKLDRLGRRIYKNEFRQRSLEEFKASGLSQAEFCRRLGIHWTTFNTWLLAETAREQKPASLSEKVEKYRFREVTISGETSVDTGEVRLHFPSGLEATLPSMNTEQMTAVFLQLEKGLSSC